MRHPRRVAKQRPLLRTARMFAATLLLWAGVVVIGSIATSTTAQASDSSCFQTPGSAPSIPAITAAPGTSDWSQQQQAAMRTELDLNASPSAIAAADSDPNATDDDAGIPLTATESQAVEAQNDFTVNGGTVDAYEALNPDSLYGGSYVDPGNPMQLDVEFPAGDCSEFSTLSGQFPGVDMVAVLAANQVTLSTLNAEADALDSNLSQIEADGIDLNRYFVDIPHNSLDIVFASVPMTNGDEQTIEGMIGGAGLSFSVDTTLVQPADANYPYDPRVNPDVTNIFGGQDITDNSDPSTSVRCTSNISVQGPKHTFVVTAGHCFMNTDEDVSQNAGDYSHMKNYSLDKSFSSEEGDPTTNGAHIKCDCEIIGPVVPASRGVQSYLNKNNVAVALQTYAGDDSEYRLGRLVCEDGVSAYGVYGTVVCHRINANDVRQHETGDGLSFWLQDAFSWYAIAPGVMGVIAGDSGAPTYSTKGAGAGKLPMLTGIVSGFANTADSAYGVFSKADNIFVPYPNVTWQGLSKS